MIRRLEKRFGRLCRKALEDGTLRTETSEKEMFFAALHPMLDVITRQAVGLVYNGEKVAGALRMQKEMLMKRFISEG
jgi:hypothetical protein